MEKLVLTANLSGDLNLGLKNILRNLYDFYDENLHLADTEKLGRVENAIEMIEEAIEIKT